MIKQDELVHNIIRRPKRPRAILLAPTRELALQTASILKRLTHIFKLSSMCVTTVSGRWKYLRSQLDRGVDIIVATPGRLCQMLEKGDVYLSDCRYVAIDEADTMLDTHSEFEASLRELLMPITKRMSRHITNSNASNNASNNTFPTKFILACASLPQRMSQRIRVQFPSIKAIRTKTVHKTLPNLRQSFVRVQGTQDKMEILLDTIEKHFQKTHTQTQSQRQTQSQSQLIVFANTVPSNRAVEHTLRNSGYSSVGYHGAMPKTIRDAAFEEFVRGHVSILVATDLAARGLDTTFVHHVINFDFPMNTVEYLHRAGRTARFGSKGQVTSLVTKRDLPLMAIIQDAQKKGKPIIA
jgi:superfamily II DNA/RNA helicase